MSDLFGMTLDIRENIATLTFDLPGEKVNKLSSKVLHSLGDAIEKIESAAGVRACILQSAKPDLFIAGADIEEIFTAADAETVRKDVMLVHELFLRLEKLPFPVVAMIHGACLGGGLELALACHYRIATDHPKTKIGLPEVMLGIIPGFGGTQRLPRLIGLQRSLPLILTGKALDAKRALRQGLVDAVIPASRIETHVQEFIRKLPSDRKKILARRRPQGLLPRLLETVGRSLIYSQAKKSVLRQTKGHYPAPLEAIESVRQGFGKSLRAGLEGEAQILSRLATSKISKHLIQIYFLTERVKKSNGTAQLSVDTKAITQTAVLGAGVMGGGIAQLFADKDMDVRLKDISWDAIALGKKQAASILQQKVKRKRISRRECSRKLGRITGTLDYSGFRRCNLVVEAIVENMDIKKKIFAELATHVHPDCVVASNTSSLSVTEMGSAYAHPQNFAGLHFFNPVHRMPLVEIIRGKDTSDATVATLFQFSKRLGKTPIVVNDGPGFLVNRLLLPYLNEACFLLEEGCSVDRADRVMTTFGMPMGPCLLIDEVGIDVADKVAGIFQKAFGSRVQGSTVIAKLHGAGRLGKKGGLGLYTHNGRPQVDAGVYAIIQPKSGFALSDEEMVRRMVYPMINEAARCLEEGIVERADDVDIGMIFGTGFPPFRGGLLRFAESEGLATVLSALESMAAKHGSRFLPCDSLKKVVQEKGSFYTQTS